MISGDSAEYELLAQGVELSKEVAGILCEVGLREGMGTKVIIDAAIIHRPGSVVLSIDPYGSIPYKPRHHVEPCRLDYTNDMHKQCVADMSTYVIGKPVEWLFTKLTDEQFFERYSDGVPVYDLEEMVVNKYAFVHLDGPHSVADVCREIAWFSERMDSGAILAIDDISPDFIPLEEVEDFMGINDENGLFERVVKGQKKALYKRI